MADLRYARTRFDHAGDTDRSATGRPVLKTGFSSGPNPCPGLNYDYSTGPRASLASPPIRSNGMSFQRKYAELNKYLKDLTTHNPELANVRAAAFPYWFAQAVLLHPDDKEALLRCLVGGSNDRNLDIIAHNHNAKEVYLCQTKCRDKLLKTNEKLNDVVGFAQVAGSFTERNRDRFLRHFEAANADVRERLNDAWHLVQRQKYRLQLFYVTTGKVSQQVADEARDVAEAQNRDAAFFLYDGRDCCRLFEDFQSLVPAIPHIEFFHVRDRMSAHSCDHQVSSVVFPASASQLGAIVHTHGERLFARNVRLDKGEAASVNRQIAESLKRNPKYFLYFNNGVTVLGRSVDVKDDRTGGGYRVRVYEPQIINGQQTTRTIGRSPSVSKDAEVLVRVVCRQPGSDDDVHAFRDFITTVVRATNSQTKVAASELAANNPEQIVIEQALKRLNWRYIRKAGKADERQFRWYRKQKPYGAIKLKELATALVSCLHVPNYIRQHGIESIFEQSDGSQRLYHKLFSDRRTQQEYLFAYLLLACAGQIDRQRGKQTAKLMGLGQYFVANRLHDLLRPLFKSHEEELLTALSSQAHKRQFIDQIKDLKSPIEDGWKLFFDKRSTGDEDPLDFVTRLKDNDWAQFWASRTNSKSRLRAAKAIRRLQAVIRGEG